MAEAVVENEACSKCGAEVREGTAFCYACGGRVREEPEEEQPVNDRTHADNSQAALDDLARKLRDDHPTPEKAATDDKIAKAAAERKKARVKKASREFVWEPRTDMPVALLITVLVIAVAAVLAVLVTVIWK